MKQLHIVSSLLLSFGGVAASVNTYARALVCHQIDVDVLIVDDAQSPNDIFVKHTIKNLNFVAKILCIKRLINSSDVVHIHGIWTAVHNLVALFCIIIRKPYIFSIHGSLENGAFEHKYVKKLIAFNLYQKYILNKSSLIFATSTQEMLGIRAKGVCAPVAIIPLSVQAQESTSRTTSNNQALFLARIHPIKGLENLIAAWSMVSNPSWSLVIAGNDENGYADKVVELINRQKNKSNIKYIGPVYGIDKKNLYLQSDLFILPSFSENFGLSIAEALSYSLPVITTDKTPWNLIQDYNAGWFIKTTVEDLATAIEGAFKLKQSELKRMGVNGRTLILENFDSNNIMTMAIESAYWIFSNQNDCPNFIFAK